MYIVYICFKSIFEYHSFDLMDSLAFFCIILAFFAGFGASFVYNWHIKRTALSITRGLAGENGRKSKKEQESELMELITEATMLFKNAKKENKDLGNAALEIVPHLAGKYPMTMLKQGKKLYKLISENGFEGLTEDMFQ